MKINLYNENCFNIFQKLSNQSVDMVCVDPPYGTTSIEWDKTNQKPISLFLVVNLLLVLLLLVGLIGFDMN